WRGGPHGGHREPSQGRGGASRRAARLTDADARRGGDGAHGGGTGGLTRGTAAGGTVSGGAGPSAAVGRRGSRNPATVELRSSLEVMRRPAAEEMQPCLSPSSSLPPRPPLVGPRGLLLPLSLHHLPHQNWHRGTTDPTLRRAGPTLAVRIRCRAASSSRIPSARPPCDGVSLPRRRQRGPRLQPAGLP
ncbi:unnamed protein product, partial [Urochloa humidicola]